MAPVTVILPWESGQSDRAHTMDWTGVISNVVNNIVGVSRMTVCSSPHLEALRLLSEKEGNSSSGETESEGRGGFKLGSCVAPGHFSPSL